MKLSEMTSELQQVFLHAIKTAVAESHTARWVQDVMEGGHDIKVGQRMVQRYMEKQRKDGYVEAPESEDEKVKNQLGKKSFKVTGSGTAEYDGFTDKLITTEADAVEHSGADMTKWDVKDFECTAWQVGAKTHTDLTYNDTKQLIHVKKQMTVKQLWRINVKFKAKVGWNPSEFRKLLIEDLKELAPSYRCLEYTAGREPILAELSIFDAHFGKLAWAPETGQDYDLRICKDRYMGAARDLLRRAFSKYEPERLLYVVGNDFFHCDHRNMTTNDTEVDCDGRWQKAFRAGVQCCITLAEEAANDCPVDIMVVPGNHDREKAFCLGEVLEARFHTHTGITVMNDPDLYSYYRWGKNLLGFVHGDFHTNDKKRHLLPVQMATDRPVDWSETIWREWHLGHFHSELEDVWKYRTVDEIRDLVLRILPSLSGTDAWHRNMGFASVLAAECHLYHKNKGRAGYLVHQVEP